MVGKIEFIYPAGGSLAEMSDNDLVAACGTGERAALGILFRKYHLDVYRFISALIGMDNHNLDDLVQETFLGVRSGSKRFTGTSSAKTWIFGIAANVVRNSIRTESRRRKVADSFRDVSDPVSETPLVLVEQRDLLKRMQTALNKLTHDQRVVMLMCVFEEIPGVEVAKLLGLRPGTLWRRLHEARKSLAREMERSQA